MTALEDIRVEESLYRMLANSGSKEIFDMWRIHLEKLYPYIPKKNIDELFNKFRDK